MSEDQLLLAVGARLLALRGAESQSAFAGRVGVHPKTVQRWEAAAALPDGESLISLWREYGADPGWVLTGSAKPPELSAQERLLMSLFRSAPEAIQRAALGVLASANTKALSLSETKAPAHSPTRPKDTYNVQFHAGVGNVIRGDQTITGGLHVGDTARPRKRAPKP